LCIEATAWDVAWHTIARFSDQVERMDSVGAVRSFKFRIVVATDLAARGLDLPAVNLVRRLFVTMTAVQRSIWAAVSGDSYASDGSSVSSDSSSLMNE
jgi:excinuclease UvrABC helicase subunit UvrB